MAQNYNVEINRYNGTDYDGLFPKNTITGTTDPTTSTKGFIGQFYANISTNPAKMWQCVGESGGVYSWKEIIDVDAFTKEETLTPATAALYGLGAGAVPDDVLTAIKTLINNTTKVVSGSYVGTGTTSNSIPVGFAPKLVIVFGMDNSGISFKIANSVSYFIDVGPVNEGKKVTTYGLTASGFLVSTTEYVFYTANSMNESGLNYRYCAIG